MTEAEIAAVLQSRLAAPAKIAVKRRQGHVHVLLGHSAEVQLDYPCLTKQIQAELKALGLSGLEQVTVYGRKFGHTEYDWEQTHPLYPPSSAMPDTTISLANPEDLEDITGVAPEAVTQQNNPAKPSETSKRGSLLPWLGVGAALLAVVVGVLIVVLL